MARTGAALLILCVGALASCVTDQVNVLSLEVDRVDKDLLYLRMEIDTDLTAERYEKCVDRFDYLPYDRQRPVRRYVEDWYGSESW